MARKASKDGMGGEVFKVVLMARSALSLVLLLSYLAPWNKVCHLIWTEYLDWVGKDEKEVQGWTNLFKVL